MHRMHRMHRMLRLGTLSARRSRGSSARNARHLRAGRHAARTRTAFAHSLANLVVKIVPKWHDQANKGSQRPVLIAHRQLEKVVGMTLGGRARTCLGRDWLLDGSPEYAETSS